MKEDCAALVLQAYLDCIFMNDSSSSDGQWLSGLYKALAPTVVEVDAADKITRTLGESEGLLGATELSLVGQVFTTYIHDKDLPIWSLIRHRLLKLPHLGPLPLRLRDINGAKGAFEVHVARSETEKGHLLLSLAPYHGQLSLGENKRPESSVARTFAKEDFKDLAKRLTNYAASSKTTIGEALIQLAGLGGEEAGQSTPETSLWALYRLLHDAGSEGAAKNLSEQTRQGYENVRRDADEGEVEGDGKMAEAVRGAYIQGDKETNYVTVAGEDGISESEAVKAAVYAMKKAATAGRAKTMQALTGGYEKRLETAKNQLRAFKKIVVQERFEVALQPIVNIADGGLHHYEALARFDADHYAGSPFEFMCFAEDIGVIQEFDLAMVLKVVTLIKRMRRIGYNVGVAVNISGRSIQSQAFLRHFFRILEDCGDIRHLLMFELTESSQIEDLETTNRILSRIRDFGHKVALDDFGAGAAGLQYLRVLKVDCVKIDGIYIRNAIEDAENRSFLRSMAELCKGLNIETVGECVETEEQRGFLEGIGVTYAQGWLYGKPMPVDEALKALADH